MAPRIESYRFGRLEVDGRTYRSDVILRPDGVVETWWRVTGHSLIVADLAAALEAKPEVLIIGQGAVGRMAVPTETLEHLCKCGIKVIVQPTDAACKTYNHVRDSQRVVAALHLAC